MVLTQKKRATPLLTEPPQLPMRTAVIKPIKLNTAHTPHKMQYYSLVSFSVEEVRQGAQLVTQKRCRLLRLIAARMPKIAATMVRIPITNQTMAVRLAAMPMAAETVVKMPRIWEGT